MGGKNVKLRYTIINSRVLLWIIQPAPKPISANLTSIWATLLFQASRSSITFQGQMGRKKTDLAPILINSLAPGRCKKSWKISSSKPILGKCNWCFYCGTGLGWMPIFSSQHWFRLWLGAVRQQAITWANVDQCLCRHMASLGANELTYGTNFFSKKIQHLFFRSWWGVFF